MTLILRTPTLQAHSVLRYADWRDVISEYVTQQRGTDSDSIFAQTVADAAWLDQAGASPAPAHRVDGVPARRRPGRTAWLTVPVETIARHGPATRTPEWVL